MYGNTKAILRKKNRGGGFTLHDLTTLQSYSHQNYVALAEKQTHRSKEQNREPRKKKKYVQLVYENCGKIIQWGKNSLFNKWSWENWTATYNTMTLEHFLIP